MQKKVVLVLVDGMRPDSIPICGNPNFETFFRESTFSFDASTVYPSLTLPCHMSLFHSVDPDRHGTMTNTYVPMAKPVDGLIEQMAKVGKKTAFFTSWAELRDLCRAEKCLSFYWCMSYHAHMEENVDIRATEAAKAYFTEQNPDFTFLYLGRTDEIGHKYGWMSPEYLAAVKVASECIEDMYSVLGEQDTLIVTADHGGHLRIHGAGEPEDMRIPLMFRGPDFKSGCQLPGANIKDIAPTIAEVMGLETCRDWEGRLLL